MTNPDIIDLENIVDQKRLAESILIDIDDYCDATPTATKVIVNTWAARLSADLVHGSCSIRFVGRSYRTSTLMILKET